MKKIILPTLLCFNISPLVLPLVMLALLIAEIIMEALSSKYKQKRFLVYKIVEAALCIEHATFAGVDSISNNETQSKATTLSIEITLFIYLSIPLFELCQYLYNRYGNNNKDQNQEQFKPEEVTIQDIHLHPITVSVDTTISMQK